MKPFSLVQELNVLTSAAARRDLAGRQRVTIRGTLDYQACDDRICYAPTSVPLEFTLELASGGGR